MIQLRIKGVILAFSRVTLEGVQKEAWSRN